MSLSRAMADRKPAFARWALQTAAMLPAFATDDRVSRCHAHLKLGQPQIAEQELRQAYENAGRASSRWSLAIAVSGAMFAMSRNEEGIHWLQTAVENAPDDENGLTHLALGLVRGGRPNDAEPILNDIICRFDTPLAYFGLSQVYAAQGKIDEAIAANFRALSMRTIHHPWRGHLSTLLSRAGRVSEAEALHIEAVRTICDAGSWFEWSKFLWSQARLEESLDAARHSVRLTPSHLAMRDHLASLLMESGQTDEALTLCQESVRVWIGGGGAKARLALVLERSGRVHEAIMTAREAVIDEPAIAAHPAVLLDLLLRADDLDGAAQAEVGAHGAIYGPAPALLLARGRLHVRLGNIDQAIYLFEQAILFSPENAGIYGTLANCLLRAGRLNEAELAARRALRLQPKPLWLHRVLIAAVERSGRIEDAIALCDTAVSANPDNAEFRVKLANLLFLTDKMQQAAIVISEAFKAGFTTAILYSTKAKIAARTGDIPGAIDAGQRATAMDPGNGVFHAELANYHLRAGNIEEAEMFVHEGVRLRPGIAWIHQLQSAIFERQGRIDKAIEACRAAIESSAGGSSHSANLTRLIEKQKLQNPITNHAGALSTPSATIK